MGNRLPKIFTGSRICIICEGDEECENLEADLYELLNEVSL